MRDAPSWFPLVFAAFGAALILPVLIVGVASGTWRRTAVVAGGMTLLWAAFFVFYTQVGLPPFWVPMVIVYLVAPVLLWRNWSRVGPIFGFGSKRRPTTRE